MACYCICCGKRKGVVYHCAFGTGGVNKCEN